MPVEPPWEVLLWLAGNPVILAASDEQSYRMQWAQLREMLKDATVCRKMFKAQAGKPNAEDKRK